MPNKLSQFWQELKRRMEIPVNVSTSNRRRVLKYAVVYTHDQAALKSVYLAISNIEKKWTMPIQNWGMILQQFLIKFEDRCRI